MKRTVLLLFILLSFSIIAFAQPSQTTNCSEDISSQELIIAWKGGVPDTEKNRIITEYGGKLRRRFTIVKADSVLFDNEDERIWAQRALSKHSSIRFLRDNDKN